MVALPEGVRLKRVGIGKLELLEKNARYMTSETFKQLVANVKRDGGLTSVPFCWRTPDGMYRVLSGNHRVMAAKEAGLDEVVIYYVYPQGPVPQGTGSDSTVAQCNIW